VVVRLPIWVDIDGIARHIGLSVRYESIAENDKDKIAFLSDGLRPLAVYRGNEPELIIFPKDTVILDKFLLRSGEETRRRFSLAHEVGHKIIFLTDPTQQAACFETLMDNERSYTIDKFYQSLLTVKPKPRPYQKTTNACMSARGIKEIHKLLRSAFNQAVKWELISHNPVVNCTPPKSTEKERQIWSAETLFEALEKCNNDILSLALNLAFSCSLRMGEMLGLTWDCIDITEESINANRAYIFVNKELQRVSR
jgi:integrase